MAKTKKEYILATFFVSCISTIVTIASIATDQWIQATANNKFNTTVDLTGEVNYGLFKGDWVVKSAIERRYSIKITCVMEDNVCGWSYEDTSDKREQEIKDFLSGKSCKNNDVTRMRYPNVYKDDEMSQIQCDLTFLNAGLWICTLLFLSLSMLMSAETAGQSILNYVSNPTLDYLGLWGLSIWNGIGAGCYLLTIIMWSSEFGACIAKNIGVHETLKGQLSSEGSASMGYSFWILIIPMVLHVANIGILYFRQYQIDKEPTAPTIEINPQKDGLVFLY